MENALSLYELNRLIKAGLQDAFPETCWVSAEIAECKRNYSGHCYLDLIEKKENSDQLKAKTRAVIWADAYFPLSLRFEEMTGTPLGVGQKILAQVEVNYHELFGLSLNIVDIDPSYTFGDWMLRRQEIVRHLEADGVIDMNRELEWPALPQRIAVISSEQAAGYGDFMNQLESNGFAFYVKLFPAVVQGNGAEESILSALDRVAARLDDFDVLVLIRGGGAATDLSCFDSYALCSALAQFPIPVLTGLGHQRDQSVADRVACVSVKTPTAAAEFLSDSMSRQSELLGSQAVRLKESVSRLLMAGAANLEQSARRLDISSRSILQRAEMQLESLHIRLKSQTKQSLAAACHRLELTAKEIDSYSPRKQLERGFSITTSAGRLVKSVSDLKAGDELETRLKDGTVKSTII